MTAQHAGKRLGRYQLGEQLGAGSMGSVFRARDEALGRDVAVKAIHTVGRSQFQVEMFQARFENEARALAALAHPHVVNVFDVGVDDGTPFLVLELVEGRSLADRLAFDGPLDSDAARALGRQIADALDAAHARGIVHRDVKPGNVLEAAPGQWKLADFGVAHLPDSSLTLTGQFLGSPAYAAPESLEQGLFGPATDVYGLGATLYEAVSGEAPYGSAGLMAPGALASGSSAPPVSEACATVAPDLARAIMAALERSPDRRPTARQLIGILTGRPAAPPPAAAAVPPPMPVADPRRRALLVGGALLLLVLGISLGVGLSSDDEAAPRPTGAVGPPGGAAFAPPADRWDGEPPPSRRLSRKDAHKQEKDWRKVADKLRDGKPEKAVGHLRKILERDPGDQRARELYRQITGYDWDDWDD
jgi:serine/threonine protein kinase